MFSGIIQALGKISRIDKRGSGGEGGTVPVSSSGVDVEKLLALAKAQPGKLSYASSGTGGSPHLAGELLKLTANIDIVHVPYRGAGQAVTDLLAGHVKSAFLGPTSMIPHWKAGSIKFLAQTSHKRAPTLPDLPTLAEAGVPGYEAVVDGVALARIERERNAALDRYRRDRTAGFPKEFDDAVAGSVSSVRPPWLETMMPPTCRWAAWRASSGWRMPFRMTGSRVSACSRAMSSQVGAMWRRSSKRALWPGCKAMFGRGGRVARLTAEMPGGRWKPARRSRSRAPWQGASTVSTRAS